MVALGSRAGTCNDHNDDNGDKEEDDYHYDTGDDHADTIKLEDLNHYNSSPAFSSSSSSSL